jgi:hypothetical protein
MHLVESCGICASFKAGGVCVPERAAADSSVALF